MTAERRTSESDGFGVCGKDGVKVDTSERREDWDCEGGKVWEGSNVGDGEAVEGGEVL